jgi:simple sugar transport system ATP-binding protein
MMTENMVEMRGISKHFGAVSVLEEVSLSVAEGEIVALLGDNGAGKSTLIKILSGVIQPDHGEILVRGERVKFSSTREAIGAGIETIYQNAALVNELSVARNLFLGREPVKRLAGVLPRLDHGQMASEATVLLKRMGLHRDVNPNAGIARLSGGERQSIAIARAMYFDADLIILDEPTNTLGVEETRGVLEFIRGAKEAGRSTIFITHNIFHVFQVVDRIAILRRGRKVADLVREETTMDDVERLIVGLGERTAPV